MNNSIKPLQKPYVQEAADEYSAQRLYEWALALQREGNDLGDSLMPYAVAWLEEVERLSVELAKCKSTIEMQSSELKRVSTELACKIRECNSLRATLFNSKLNEQK